MGLFDSLYVDCPHCGNPVEFQSKEDECYMNVWRSFDVTPTDVLYDVMNYPEFCAKCQGWMALIDPNHPPHAEKPRPNLRAVKVRTPEKPDIHSTQGDRLRWWPSETPFTYADVLDDASTQQT